MSAAIETANSVNGDEIAVAAVRDFCRRPRPMREDMVRLVDLVLPLLNQIRDESRRRIAASLATCDHAPKALLLALCDFPAAVCSPILTRSRHLTDAEMLAILSQHGEEHARAIARRPKLADPVLNALRSFESEAVDRALKLRRRLDEALPPERQHSFDMFEATLHGDLVDHATPVVAIDIDKLVSLAQDPNPVLFRTAIADALGVTLTSATELCANPTSRNMIYMLRFLKVPLEKAFAIFCALAPELSGDPDVATRFGEAFRETPVETAVRKVWSWRSDDLLALAREAFAANESEVATGSEKVDNSFLKVA